jgi:cytochrome c oxidase subunit 4
MSDSHSPEEIRKHVRIYITVFAALAVLTVATVGASYLNLPIAAAVVLALFIASIKGTLVAGFFMHLISEKKAIYWILMLTAAFFVVLMSVPLFARLDQVHTPEARAPQVQEHHVP